MRKILISLLVILLLVLLGMTVIYGMKIGNFELGHSVKEIIDNNDNLDVEISALTAEINTNYLKAQSSLNSSLAKLQTEKENYLNKVRYTTEEEMQKANVSEQYKISYIWTTIGLYATKNYCQSLKIEVSNSTSGVPNQYNLTITTTGNYLDISNFIYAIEKDSNLGFRIEEFNMVPYAQTTSNSQNTNENENENILQATFMVKNITLDPASLNTNNITNSNTSNSDQVLDNSQNTGS